MAASAAGKSTPAEAGLPFLVAERGGVIVGYALCARWRGRPAYRHTLEDSVYVVPHALGAGVGRELLRRCAEAGVRQVIAVVPDTGDDYSTALPRRFGFTVAGRLAGVGHKQASGWRPC